MPGPVPKRSDQRRRTNSPRADRVAVEGAVRGPDLEGEHCSSGVRMYEAMRRSGQAAFFEPSDWAMAQWAVELMDRFEAKPQAVMAQVIQSMWTNLLATEGDRRRLRVELERVTEDADESAAVAALDDYRRRISG